MITLYRAAYSDAIRARVMSGLSTDTKPLDVENGATFNEIDTGKVYRFDMANKTWYEGRA